MSWHRCEASGFAFRLRLITTFNEDSSTTSEKQAVSKGLFQKYSLHMWKRMGQNIQSPQSFLHLGLRGVRELWNLRHGGPEKKTLSASYLNLLGFKN